MTVERELQRRTAGERLVELDALRGVAAAVVVFHHLRLFTSRFPLHWYAVPFFAGSQAVALFFVLSGFVLSLPYWRGRQQRYRTYAARRLARIYLPYAAAAMLSVLAALLFQQSPKGLDHYFYSVWHAPITAGSLWGLGCIWPQTQYNVSFWSLRYEVQISLMLPALLWLLRRGGSRWVLPGSFLVAYASTSLVERMNRFHLLGNTVQIASLFLLGAALAWHRERITAWLGRSAVATWMLFAFSFGLFFNFVGELHVRGIPAILTDRSEALSGFGAAGLIVCALTLPELRWALRNRVAEYLGRISYSLYLVHSVTLVATLDLLYGRLPKALVFLIAVLASWGLAHLFCVLVEEPCIGLSKRLDLSPAAERARPLHVAAGT